MHAGVQAVSVVARLGWLWAMAMILVWVVPDLMRIRYVRNPPQGREERCDWFQYVARLLHLQRSLVNPMIGCIVRDRVAPHQSHVGGDVHSKALSRIMAFLDPLQHRTQIHWLLDDLSADKQHKRGAGVRGP